MKINEFLIVSGCIGRHDSLLLATLSHAVVEKKNAFHLVTAGCKSAYSGATFVFSHLVNRLNVLLTIHHRWPRLFLPREEGEDRAGQYEAVRADTGIFRRREGKVCGEIRIQ